MFALTKAFVPIYRAAHTVGSAKTCQNNPPFLSAIYRVLGNVNILHVHTCVHVWRCVSGCVHTLVNLWSAETSSTRQTLTAVIRGLHAVMLPKACRPHSHTCTSTHTHTQGRRYYREGSLGMVRSVTKTPTRKTELRKKQKKNELAGKTHICCFALFDAGWNWNINMWSDPAVGESLALRPGTPLYKCKF